MINLYGQKEESLSSKMAVKNYFHPIKIVRQKSDFRGWGSSKRTDFCPFLLDNSIATAAKKLDIFTVSRIDYKEYLKKKIIKIC